MSNEVIMLKNNIFTNIKSFFSNYIHNSNKQTNNKKNISTSKYIDIYNHLSPLEYKHVNVTAHLIDEYINHSPATMNNNEHLIEKNRLQSYYKFLIFLKKQRNFQYPDKLYHISQSENIQRIQFSVALERQNIIPYIYPAAQLNLNLIYKTINRLNNIKNNNNIPYLRKNIIYTIAYNFKSTQY